MAPGTCGILVSMYGMNNWISEFMIYVPGGDITTVAPAIMVISLGDFLGLHMGMNLTLTSWPFALVLSEHSLPLTEPWEDCSAPVREVLPGLQSLCWPGVAECQAVAKMQLRHWELDDRPSLSALGCCRWSLVVAILIKVNLYSTVPALSPVLQLQ